MPLCSFVPMLIIWDCCHLVTEKPSLTCKADWWLAQSFWKPCFIHLEIFPENTADLVGSKTERWRQTVTWVSGAISKARFPTVSAFQLLSAHCTNHCLLEDGLNLCWDFPFHAISVYLQKRFRERKVRYFYKKRSTSRRISSYLFSQQILTALLLWLSIC